MLKFVWSILLLTLLLLNGCSTRGLDDRYASVTEQRLVTQSLDKLIRALPEQDFQQLQAQKVYLRAYFIEQPSYPEAHLVEQSSLLAFAQQRFGLELLEKYACRLVDNPEQADYQIHFFFNAIGTDQDKLGITTPELFLPGVAGVQIDFFAVEMFHGVSEGYYFIVDSQQAKTFRGSLQQARVRTDRLNLPFFSIPLNTLD